MTIIRPYIPRQPQNAAAAAAYRGTISSELKIWWREVDGVLLSLILILMFIGTLAVAAASPASAERLSTKGVQLPELYFYWKHVQFQFIGLLALFGSAMLNSINTRRLGIVIAAVAYFLLVLVPLVGYEVNGAKRWINLGINIQPSELLKPGFSILLAWILTWRIRNPNIPVIGVVTVIMGITGILLMLEPNLGETVLFAGVWLVLILLAGVSVWRMAALGGFILGGMIAAYVFYENARNRIDAFLGGSDGYDQVFLAERTLLSGGWTGSGMWLGVRKMVLPEAHTDYIFSVIGEEFGLLTCALLVLLYLAILVRVLVRLSEEEDLFTVLAGTGLVCQIGGQAFINILVNLQLFPSKGMTLPLVSYGGSSTITVCLTAGLLLAITRKNPYLTTQTPRLKVLLADYGSMKNRAHKDGALKNRAMKERNML